MIFYFDVEYDFYLSSDCLLWGVNDRRIGSERTSLIETFV